MISAPTIATSIAIFLLSGCVETQSETRQSSSTKPKTETSEKFRQPGVCQVIYGRSTTANGALLIGEAVQKRMGWKKSNIGVYQMFDGSFAAVEDNKYNDSRLRYDEQKTAKKQRLVAYRIREGEFPIGTRCTEGADLKDYTGIRVKDTEKPSRGGG
jgi:hypothetical protein